ncbi:MAG: rod shape-determining protein MreC, partial [Corallincola sp.]|nr:rod shape-determining protein MreC [Corallincola sp.]
GRFDGVYEGQPVLDERGIVGQVVAVGPTTSRVLLIADDMHAIPVRIYRNDVRAIAVGSGELDRLTLQYLPHSTDVRVGDLLVASGLGGRFPEGYPVARVTHVDRNERSSFARVDAVPEASLDRLRYLLLLWPQLRDETGQPLPAAAPAATTPTAPEVKP